jgi:hypothetical protein
MTNPYFQEYIFEPMKLIRKKAESLDELERSLDE